MCIQYVLRTNCKECQEAYLPDKELDLEMCEDRKKSKHCGAPRRNIVDYEGGTCGGCIMDQAKTLREQAISEGRGPSDKEWPTTQL
jgi:hypothetical protein